MRGLYNYWPDWSIFYLIFFSRVKSFNLLFLSSKNPFNLSSKFPCALLLTICSDILFKDGLKPVWLWECFREQDCKLFLSSFRKLLLLLRTSCLLIMLTSGLKEQFSNYFSAISILYAYFFSSECFACSWRWSCIDIFL